MAEIVNTRMAVTWSLKSLLAPEAARLLTRDVWGLNTGRLVRLSRLIEYRL